MSSHKVMERRLEESNQPAVATSALPQTERSGEGKGEKEIDRELETQRGQRDGKERGVS